MSAQTHFGRIALVLAATVVASMPPPPAQAQTSSRSNAGSAKVVRIIANGSDGDVTYYGVRCANGARGDVRIEHEARQTCAVPQGGESRCSAKWSIQRAGEHVCETSGR